jgi:hypothetical protein
MPERTSLKVEKVWALSARSASSIALGQWEGVVKQRC